MSSGGIDSCVSVVRLMACCGGGSLVVLMLMLCCIVYIFIISYLTSFVSLLLQRLALCDEIQYIFVTLISSLPFCVHLSIFPLVHISFWFLFHPASSRADLEDNETFTHRRGCHETSSRPQRPSGKPSRLGTVAKDI